MPKDVVLRVSKSSLVQFAFCEMQYFIKYVLGVKEPANDNMTRGTNVHDAVEHYYDHIAPHLDELYTLMQRGKRACPENGFKHEEPPAPGMRSGSRRARDAIG